MIDVCEDFEDVSREPVPALSLARASGVPPVGGTVTDDLPSFVGVCPDAAGATGTVVVVVDELIFGDSLIAILLCLEDAVNSADESAEDGASCRRVSACFIMVSVK